MKMEHYHFNSTVGHAFLMLLVSVSMAVIRYCLVFQVNDSEVLLVF